MEYNVYKKVEDGKTVDVYVGNKCPNGFQFVIRVGSLTEGLHCADGIMMDAKPRRKVRHNPTSAEGYNPSLY